MLCKLYTEETKKNNNYLYRPYEEVAGIIAQRLPVLPAVYASILVYAVLRARACLLEVPLGSKYGLSPIPTALFPKRSPSPS